MSTRDGGGIVRTTLDRWTADRLLSGSVEPDDAPPGFGEVARLLQVVAAPASARDLASRASAVAAARTVLGALSAAAPAGSGAPSPRRRSRFLRRAKITALVTVGALVGTSGLAAAGVLPDPVQSTVAGVLDTVGIRVPNPSDVERPATTGKEISEIATTTDAKGVDKGAEISTAASGGTGRAGEEHGPPADAGNEDRGDQDRGAGGDAPKGKPDEPGSEANGKPDGPGSHENGKPEAPGSQGIAKPDDPGSQGEEVSDPAGDGNRAAGSGPPSSP